MRQDRITTRRKLIAFRVSEREDRLARTLAAANDQTVSEWLRDRIGDGARRELESLVGSA